MGRKRCSFGDYRGHCDAPSLYWRGLDAIMIHLENISKLFVTDEVETRALDGVTLDIQKGEYVAISGPSGCGKSTLLAILGLLDAPTSGAYALNGRPVQTFKASERARIRN